MPNWSSTIITKFHTCCFYTPALRAFECCWRSWDIALCHCVRITFILAEDLIALCCCSGRVIERSVRRGAPICLIFERAKEIQFPASVPFHQDETCWTMQKSFYRMNMAIDKGMRLRAWQTGCRCFQNGTRMKAIITVGALNSSIILLKKIIPKVSIRNLEDDKYTPGFRVWCPLFSKAHIVFLHFKVAQVIFLTA